ncbi:hypothetical protein Pav013_1514 [Pseudomonas syringae pv. avellanae str. ISPaVe013]|nr:hypothetical protein Pav013_1514 [Pseudomonas syringae pv. avellanae str. ISPaVe013]
MSRDEFFNKGGLADKGQVKRGSSCQAREACLNNVAGTEVPAHCVDRDDRSGQEITRQRPCRSLYDHGIRLLAIRGDAGEFHQWSFLPTECLPQERRANDACHGQSGIFCSAEQP